MEPNAAQAEANRWIEISTKLLNTRDFVGCKSFATRARVADPHNPLADQILAVVDTLTASQKRVLNSTTHDWYSVLQLPHLITTPDLIRSHYSRLFSLLNPDYNSLPFSDLAFRFVIDAYSVLSDPSQKWNYDSQLSLFLDRADDFVDHIPESSHPWLYQQQEGFNSSTFQPPQQLEQQFVSQPQTQQIPIEQEIPNLQPGKMPMEEQESGIESFWTTCPYCYYTYEYQKRYLDCTLRCQHCRRAFQALENLNPPTITSDGKEETTTFECWGCFPLGFSMEAWRKGNGMGSVYTPFTPMRAPSRPKKRNYAREPVVFIDDDDVDFDALYVSEDSDTSDDLYGSGKKRKSGRKGGVGRKNDAER